VIKRIVLAALVMALLVSGMAGCDSRDQDAIEAGGEIPVSTATAEPATAADASATAEASGSDAAGDETNPDTAAIEAELSAIETELGSMSMPGDSDFSALEGDIN